MRKQSAQILLPKSSLNQYLTSHWSNNRVYLNGPFAPETMLWRLHTAMEIYQRFVELPQNMLKCLISSQRSYNVARALSAYKASLRSTQICWSAHTVRVRFSLTFILCVVHFVGKHSYPLQLFGWMFNVLIMHTVFNVFIYAHLASWNTNVLIWRSVYRKQVTCVIGCFI